MNWFWVVFSGVLALSVVLEQSSLTLLVSVVVGMNEESERCWVILSIELGRREVLEEGPAEGEGSQTGELAWIERGWLTMS